MPRRVQDILPQDRRSIRDIPLDKVSTKRSSTKSVEKEEIVPIHISKSEPKISKSANKISLTPPLPRKKKRKGGKWLIITLGVVIIIVGAGFAASTLFSRASFTIVPKSMQISVNNTYVAYGAPKPDQLGYELVTLKGSASSTISASDGPQTSTKSQGKVTLYNGYSSATVRLVAGTRIANDSGLIYRLVSSVVVPGYTKPSGNIIPGTLVASVIADEAGQKYNISRTDSVSDFKIVAYKGTAKYDTIYARLSTDFTGGFVGTKKVIDPKLLASTTEKLKSGLNASLLEKIKMSIPTDYILYPNSFTTTYSPVTTESAGSASAVVSEQAVMNAIIFKKADLVRALGGDKAIDSFGPFEFSAPGLESMDFSLSNIKDFTPDKKSTAIIHMKGNLELVGTVPVDQLKKKLAGLSLSETTDVLRSYSPVIDIKQSSGELAPPWAKVPTDPDRIVVKVVQD